MIAAVASLLAGRLGVSGALAGLIARIGLLLLVLGLGVGAWALHQHRATLAIGAAHDAGQREGEAAERDRWQGAAAAERQRQATANAAALAAAQDRIAALGRERDDLMSRLEEVDHAADADPDRDAVCIDADGVRRLNALRR